MRFQADNFLKYSQTKQVDPQHIENLVAELKAAEKSIATLNGSFDLMHAGHLHMIYEASKMADVLIVALNTDASIRRYKSALRPIIPLESRLQMMSALEFVDYVTWFDETDPRGLLSRIKPTVHVNGADWGMNCIEASTIRENGGRLHIVELVPSLSTTAIVNKIRSMSE